MKSIAPLLIAVFLTALVPAQSVPDLRFGGHSLGETAKTFFSTATMAESKAPAKEYCTGLLNDSEAKQRSGAAKTGINRRDFLLSDVSGCKDVMKALGGGRAWVSTRFASEVGNGSVLFVGGKLVYLVLATESPYANVVAEMTKRFRVSDHEVNLGDPEMEGLGWDLRGMAALVFKLPPRDGTLMNLGYSKYLSRP